MAIFKCKMCGGDLHIEETDKVIECEYCGTTQTVPSADNEKKMTLFNRANRLRLANEFDKATGLYENIIAEFPEEAEAYWGLCLCNYGIEYVDDPVTGKKIPTCHRASFEKLSQDENFELAMEYADVAAQRVYRNEAREIDRINEEILSVSKNEKPYDIFICYKETDESGNRTPDSVMAQDICDALTAKGHKVFFARISLEDKLGQQYEPYIFAALNSAKIMLCIGTKYEYFHAVWVKNEWSRFLRLALKDKSKALIPCFKNMDPYDLPDAFKGLQAQDLGKLGATQDLVRGVEKLLAKDQPAQTATVQPVTASPAGATVDSLLKRAFIFLEDEDWKKADDFCEQVLNIDPENENAYLGKLLAELHVRQQKDLLDSKEPFDSSKNYSKILRFGDAQLSDTLNSYISQINERNKNDQLMDIYNRAITAMNTAVTRSEYMAAAKLFQTIPSFNNATECAEHCLENARICQKAINLRNTINIKQNQLDAIGYQISSLTEKRDSLWHFAKKEKRDIDSQLAELSEKKFALESEITAIQTELVNYGFKGEDYGNP